MYDLDAGTYDVCGTRQNDVGKYISRCIYYSCWILKFKRISYTSGFQNNKI